MTQPHAVAVQCSIKGCTNRPQARGWCSTHYTRWHVHGDPHYRIKARNDTPEKAFEYYTIPEPTTGCLLWFGTLDRGGYGAIRVGKRLMRAHRYAWERANGPAPAELDVNHRCWTKACVNVEHLDLATRSQNGSYRQGPDSDRKFSGRRGIYRRVLASGEERFSVHFQGKYYGTFHTEENAHEHIRSVRKQISGAHAGR